MEYPLDQKAPALLLHRRYALEHFTRGTTLHRCHNLRWAIRGHRLQQNMDMIMARDDFQEHNFLALGNLQAHLLKDDINSLVNTARRYVAGHIA